MAVLLLVFLSAIFISFGLVSTNFYLMTISLLLLFTSNLLFAWKKNYKRGIVFLFLLSFFTFLLGKMLIYLLTGSQWWTDYSIEESTVVVVSIYFALLSIPLGVCISEKITVSQETNDIYNNNSVFKTESIQRFALLLFWLTLFASVYELISRIVFVFKYSYVDLYLSYSGVNLIISRLADVNKISFFMYLATMPSKRQAKLPIAAWVIINVASLFSGGRTNAVITLLVLLYYYTYRNKNMNGYEEIWLTDRMKRIILIATPLFISFLGAWNYLRKTSTVDLGFFGLFIDFFESQGGAFKHIAYASRYLDELPQRFYTFGPIINFLRGNILVSSITGFSMPAQNTIEAATTGYSYGQAISYVVQPWNYLAGLGMGSSYLAELYYDFGYAGIVVFNFFLGAMFSGLSRVSPKRVLSIFFMLVILDSTLNLPRNACMAWFTSLTSITLWGTLLIFYLVTYKKT